MAGYEIRRLDSTGASAHAGVEESERRMLDL
jgi:hypothetical protein